MKGKPSSRKKGSVSKSGVRRAVAAKSRGSLARKKVSMLEANSWTTVDIEQTTITIQRGFNYRLPLNFSQAPHGAGQFDSALYLTTLSALDCTEAVIQEESNYKTEQRCAWIVYVPDDGYHTTIQMTLAGQLGGTGWTGGSSVDGLWGTPEPIY